MMPLIHPAKNFDLLVLHILFCPNSNLIKDKIPVLGLDIVERQVWLYSSKKLARAWFCPSFRENQERINDSGIRMRKEEMCLGRGLGTRPMQGVFNEEPRETLASSDKEADTTFSISLRPSKSRINQLKIWLRTFSS